MPTAREKDDDDRDDDEPSDWTIDPADPEPRFADWDEPTDDELRAHSAWVVRNIDGMTARGVECPFEDD